MCIWLIDLTLSAKRCRSATKAYRGPRRQCWQDWKCLRSRLKRPRRHRFSFFFPPRAWSPVHLWIICKSGSSRPRFVGFHIYHCGSNLAEEASVGKRHSPDIFTPFAPRKIAPGTRERLPFSAPVLFCCTPCKRETARIDILCAWKRMGISDIPPLTSKTWKCLACFSRNTKQTQQPLLQSKARGELCLLATRREIL